jgi:rhodanese-related sulfurtransferase
MNLLRLLGVALGLSSFGAVAQTPGATTLPAAAYSGPAPSTTLIDVREPNEWAETGMPAGSVGVAISRADFVDAVTKTMGGDKTRPVAVICRSGTRSQRAAKALTDAGFTNVTNIGDGMIGRKEVGSGWLASGLPLQRAP